MLKNLLVLMVCGLFLSLQGCLWNDDFRSRMQPKHDIPEPKPTFNEDSKDYVGKDVVKEKQLKQDDPAMESIDDLSEIPELPEKPDSSGYYE